MRLLNLISLITVTSAWVPSASNIHSSSALSMVASSTTSSQKVADMPRGMDGRLEEAFASAKEKGEAAFVTFVTAGYPQKQGACRIKVNRPVSFYS